MELVVLKALTWQACLVFVPAVTCAGLAVRLEVTAL